MQMNEQNRKTGFLLFTTFGGFCEVEDNLKWRSDQGPVEMADRNHRVPEIRVTVGYRLRTSPITPYTPSTPSTPYSRTYTRSREDTLSQLRTRTIFKKQLKDQKTT